MKTLISKYGIPLLLLFIGTGVLTLAPDDPDFGWHFKYGEHIVTTKSILYSNIFSHTFTDYEWANSYWLSQIYLYLSYAGLGLTGGALLSSILFNIALLFILHKTNTTDTYRKLNIYTSYLLITLTLAMYNITSRPLMFSCLFLVWLSGTFLRKYPLTPIWTCLVFLIWANTHADFVLGLGVLGISLLPSFLTGSTKTRISSAFIIGSSLLITLINPYGIKLWTTLIKEANPVQFQYIGEWQPFFSNVSSTKDSIDSMDHIAFLMSSGVILITIVYGIFVKKTLPLTQLLASFIFFALSMRSSYFYRVFILISMTATVSAWLEHFSSTVKQFQTIKLPTYHKYASALLVGMLILFGSFVTTKAIIQLKHASNLNTFAKQRHFPLGAIQYIQSIDMAKQQHIRLFNRYEWGGFIIWQLPQIKVFVDGRMASWKTPEENMLKNYVSIMQTSNKNSQTLQKLFDKYQVNTVVDTPNSKVTKYLLTSSDEIWIKAYEDSDSVVLLKQDAF